MVRRTRRTPSSLVHRIAYPYDHNALRKPHRTTPRCWYAVTHRVAVCDQHRYVAAPIPRSGYHAAVFQCRRQFPTFRVFGNRTVSQRCTAFVITVLLRTKSSRNVHRHASAPTTMRLLPFLLAVPAPHAGHPVRPLPRSIRRVPAR